MSDNKLDVIKYEGDNFSLVHKSSVVDFNTMTQLVVNESQEALFYKDGQALDLFPSGRHTLNSDNIPIMKKLFAKIFKQERTPFTCEVFFINKVNVLDILWGTDSPIVLEDPKYNIIVGVRSNGQMGVRVKDSRKFVVKVVGQLVDYTVDNVKRNIKGLMLTSIKDVIAKAIIESKVSILDVSTKLLDLSKVIQDKINFELDDIGLEADHFYLNSVSCSDADLAKLRETKDKFMAEMHQIELDAIRTVKMGQAKAQSRAIQGFTYQEERKYDVLQEAASNEGTSGSLMGAGMGLGLGAGLGAGFGGVMNETTKQITNPTVDQVQCPKCQSMVKKGAKFCSECGSPMPPANKFCTECGAKVDGSAKFCPECGNKM